MNGKTALCKKLNEIYPEIGECDKDLKVAWDSKKNVWEIYFKKDGQLIKHYLEDADAVACIEGKNCIGLGVEFGQFL